MSASAGFIAMNKYLSIWPKFMSNGGCFNIKVFSDLQGDFIMQGDSTAGKC